jgi:hypothetical protein
MSNVRGVPVQELVENQDPAVLYNFDEVTKATTPIAPPTVEVPEEPKQRRRRKAEVEEVSDESDAEGAGE